MNKVLQIVIMAVLVLFFSIIVFAEDNITWIDDTLSTNLTCILRDDIRDRIYLADTGNRQLVVIDSNSLEVILRLTLDSTFRDLSISKDNSTMAIAGGTVFLVNLETFEIKKMHTDLDVISIAFDHNADLLMLSPYSSGKIYHFNPDTETVIKSFGVGDDLNTSINYGLIKTSKDGNTLYVANRTYAYLYKIDISGDTPVSLAKNDSEENGDPLNDFVISPKYNE